MVSGVTLITPTGGRPQPFALCQRYMARQTFRGAVQWIVVDDVGDVQVQGIPGWTHVVMRREPRWALGQNTLALNLLAAIPEVAYRKILFIEDDDWYAADYVATMAEKLEDADIAGESHARYYHIPNRLWWFIGNTQHASLCQTGIQSSVLPVLQRICETPNTTFIDVRLWKSVTTRRLGDTRGCVGIKGLPGRRGIGIGHRPDEGYGWKPDADLDVLKHWIGGDVSLYEEYIYGRAKSVRV